MNISNLSLNIRLTGIITLSELESITYQQLKFNRIEESFSVKLGKMIDSFTLNIGCSLHS